MSACICSYSNFRTSKSDKIWGSIGEQWAMLLMVLLEFYPVWQLGYNKNLSNLNIFCWEKFLLQLNVHLLASFVSMGRNIHYMLFNKKPSYQFNWPFQLSYKMGMSLFRSGLGKIRSIPVYYQYWPFKLITTFICPITTWFKHIYWP